VPDDKPITHDAFMRLLLGSERDVLRYIMSMVPKIDDARDILQDTAIDLWKKIDKYDSALPFTPWACRFAAIQVQRYRRQHARWSRFLTDRVADELVVRRETMAEELDTRREHLTECMAKLPVKQRGILKGYYYDNQTVEQQAESTGKSAEAIYKALQRTRHALMECIERKMTAEN
jgi:RNA polymerase sigma-70 factor (ECF subfamily)